MAAYSASKAALASFADAVRPELALSGIHLAQVQPGEAQCPPTHSLAITVSTFIRRFLSSLDRLQAEPACPLGVQTNHACLHSNPKRCKHHPKLVALPQV